MSAVLEYAETLAGLLSDELADRGNKAKATTNIRQAGPPSILVAPIPRREYDRLDGGFSATWSIYCIAVGIGDLTDAKVLDELVSVVLEVVPSVSLVEPISFPLPQVDPKAAMRCEFQTEVTP
jgi:hypothetical protein